MQTLLKVLTLAILLSGCGGEGNKTLLQSDPNAAPAIPTYSEHIKPMLSFYCGGCHTNEPVKNKDENCGDGDLVASINIGTYDCAVQRFDSIMSSSFSGVTMPPGGAMKMTGQEKAILENWQANGFPQ